MKERIEKAIEILHYLGGKSSADGWRLENMLIGFGDEIKKLEENQRIAIEALEFYADDNNYIIDVNYAPIEIDEGDKAKQALSAIRGK